MDFDEDSDDGRRNRTVVFSVLGLVTIGVLLGLLVGGLGLAAVRTVDVGSQDPTTSQSSEPTEDTSSEPPESTPTEDATTEPDPSDATLVASPTEVGSYEQINLTGSFPDLGPGVILQVQRRESGGWADFADVTATTSEGGTFATYVQTGQVGLNKFRMLMVETGDSGPTVRVQVG